MECVPSIWNCYFPQENFTIDDHRYSVIQLFFEYFRSPKGMQFIARCRKEEEILETNRKQVVSVYIDFPALDQALSIPDLAFTLQSRPNEVIGCLGISLTLSSTPRSILQKAPVGDATISRILFPRITSFPIDTLFGDLKAGSVGQLVGLTGYVIRAGPCQPLVEGAAFYCPKCGQETFVDFQDGIFEPPSCCPTKKCFNKVLDLQRSNVSANDFQRIKVQELNTADDVSRVPRTFDVEVRGAQVGQCITGDVIKVVGIVKSFQADVPRGGNRHSMKDSGIHQLYVDANSLVRIHSGRNGKASSYSLAGSEAGTARAAGAGPERGDIARSEGAAGFAESSGVSAYRSSSSNSQPSSTQTFTSEELSAIRRIATSPNCLSLLVSALCPQIFGHDLVKLGLLLGLFGGSPRDGGGLHVRSDIHVLVVGDPGLGKSQLLRAAAAAAPRSVFVCGNSVSAAGLTVSVSKESGRGGDVAIEAGALVLADKGVCCIDELDKIDCDYHALLEAMEQQSISIAKGGVVTSLRSRTSILAAANPAGGHYNRSKTVCENLKMPASLLSRFDLVFILVDQPDANLDKMISEHVMQVHALKKTRREALVGDGSDEPDREDTLSHKLRHQIKQLRSTDNISPNILRRYIEYSRIYSTPKLTKPAAKVLQRMYLTMRSEASLGNSIPVTTRHLECLIRLSQARAKVELREEVTEEDATEIVQLLQESLLDAFTTETGEVIFLGNKGCKSLSKQVKVLVSALSKESSLRQSNMFTKNEIGEVCTRLRLAADVPSLIEVMRTECYLLMKGPALFQLQTAV